jgi:histidine triad (HIT) family protein
MMSDCIFCRIARGEIPSKKVYEDEEIFAFHDINPIAPVHFMIVPKLHIPSLMDADMNHRMLLGHMLAKANELGPQPGTRRGLPHHHQHRSDRTAGGVSFAHSHPGRSRAPGVHAQAQSALKIQ